MMKTTNLVTALLATLLPAQILQAHPLGAEPQGQPATTPFVTGSGDHSYRTQPNWGSLPEEYRSATHGGIAIASDGRTFVGTESPKSGIVVLSPNGDFLGAWGSGTENAHALTLIKNTEGEEFLLAAHTKSQQVVKYDLSGKVLLKIAADAGKGLNLRGITAVTGLPSGEIFCATGYGANEVFKFDANGSLLGKAGSKGSEVDQFSCTHGMALDTRFGAPRLLIADREKGRLVHLGTDLEFLGVHATGLRRPCTMSIQGEETAVAELQGRVTILAKNGHPIAFLGDNPNRKLWAKFNAKPEQMYHGIFTAPHGIAHDPSGNLVVQDWNVNGRISKLERIRFGNDGK